MSASPSGAGDREDMDWSKSGGSPLNNFKPFVMEGIGTYALAIDEDSCARLYKGDVCIAQFEDISGDSLTPLVWTTVTRQWHNAGAVHRITEDMAARRKQKDNLSNPVKAYRDLRVFCNWLSSVIRDQEPLQTAAGETATTGNAGESQALQSAAKNSTENKHSSSKPPAAPSGTGGGGSRTGHSAPSNETLGRAGNDQKGKGGTESSAGSKDLQSENQENSRVHNQTPLSSGSKHTKRTPGSGVSKASAGSACVFDSPKIQHLPNGKTTVEMETYTHGQIFGPNDQEPKFNDFKETRRFAHLYPEGLSELSQPEFEAASGSIIAGLPRADGIELYRACCLMVPGKDKLDYINDSKIIEWKFIEPLEIFTKDRLDSLKKTFKNGIPETDFMHALIKALTVTGNISGKGNAAAKLKSVLAGKLGLSQELDKTIKDKLKEKLKKEKKGKSAEFTAKKEQPDPVFEEFQELALLLFAINRKRWKGSSDGGSSGPAAGCDSKLSSPYHDAPAQFVAYYVARLLAWPRWKIKEGIDDTEDDPEGYLEGQLVTTGHVFDRKGPTDKYVYYRSTSGNNHYECSKSAAWKGSNKPKPPNQYSNDNEMIEPVSIASAYGSSAAPGSRIGSRRNSAISTIMSGRSRFDNSVTVETSSKLRMASTRRSKKQQKKKEGEEYGESDIGNADFSDNANTPGNGGDGGAVQYERVLEIENPGEESVRSKQTQRTRTEESVKNLKKIVRKDNGRREYPQVSAISSHAAPHQQQPQDGGSNGNDERSEAEPNEMMSFITSSGRQDGLSLLSLSQNTSKTGKSAMSKQNPGRARNSKRKMSDNGGAAPLNDDRKKVINNGFGADPMDMLDTLIPDSGYVRRGNQ
jgi:hypothetical protein